MSGPTEPDHSTLARAFDATAAAYELGRPEYPEEALTFWHELGVGVERVAYPYRTTAFWSAPV
ncbi:MAG: hypothetical protein AB8G26_19640 [Ilumatobacter sp.]